MATGKMLRLGGLENSPPNTSQTANRFKVANNVVITSENYMTPRPSMTGFSQTTLGVLPIVRWDLFSSYENVSNKNRELLQVGTMDQSGLYFKDLWLNNTWVPSYNAIYTNPYTSNFSDQAVEYNKTKYLLVDSNTPHSRLLKYDGYQCNPAGISMPYGIPVPSNLNASEPGYSTTTGDRYVKVVNHSLDLQGNSITSDTLSYRTTGTIQGFNSIASGLNINNKTIIVAVGDSGICYSYDGINWDSNAIYQDFPADFPLSSVCYGTDLSGNPLFVAVCKSTTVTSHPIVVSEDGIVWRRVINDTLLTVGGGWTSICFSPAYNRFVAVRSFTGTTSQRVLTSDDGNSWVYQTCPTANDWNSVAFGDDGSGGPLFVAVAANGTTANKVMTSTNGITWTNRTSPNALNYRSVMWGAGLWIAVASNGASGSTGSMTSINGITWTNRALTGTGWSAVTFGYNLTSGNFYYLIVNENASAISKVGYSLSGTAWTYTTGVTTKPCKCIHYFYNGTADSPYIIGSNDTIPSNPPKSVMYCLESKITTGGWVEIDSPITTRIDSNVDATIFSKFLDETNNQPYYATLDDLRGFFYGKANYNSGTGRFDLTMSSGNPATPAEWTWGKLGLGWRGGIWIIRPVDYTVVSGTNIKKYTAIAYKTSINAYPAYFEGNIKLFDSSTLLWEDAHASSHPIASGYFVAGSNYYTVWASPSANGIYYYRGGGSSISGLYGSSWCISADISKTNIENPVQKAAKLPFLISGSLNDWYDIYSVKKSFNEFAVTDPLVAMTIYQDQLLIASKNIIYFSDSSSGGSFEMSSGLSSIVIGDSNYGNITSIAGTKDFLIVSRERKVYMVAGTLATAQIRVQEIQDIPVGAYSNSSMLEVEGNVVLLSSVGVWTISNSNAKKISEGIARNFKSFMRSYVGSQPSAESDSIIFDMNSYPANAYSQPNIKKYIVSAYDSYRGLVVFTDSSTAKCGESLVLHIRNGEFTNWQSFDADGNSLTAMTFINGVQYNGTQNTSDRAILSSEQSSGYDYDYAERSPSKLITAWMTAGEPSLEKQILQLKIFGYIWQDLIIRHYQDWNLATAITDDVYVSPGDTSPNNYIMFHKKRLNSSKAMAAAIEISMKPLALGTTNTFWIEGIEVEFEPIQVGMKR